MKIQSRIFAFSLSLLIVFMSFCGCSSHMERINLDYDYLSDGIKEIQIVKYIDRTESEYDKDGDRYQYKVITSLTSEQIEPFLTDLSNITFDPYVPPRGLGGYGVIMTYEDGKKIKISYYEYEDERKGKGCSLYSNEEFAALIERTLGYSIDDA